MEKKKPVMEICYNAVYMPYSMPFCPSCNEPTYSEPECPFCGQPLDWSEETKNKCDACEKETEELKEINLFGRNVMLCDKCYPKTMW